LSTLMPSRPRRFLVILACVPGVLAAAAVLAMLVLLAVDGHPEGLLAAAAGGAVPAVLWGAWRLIQLAYIRVRLHDESHGSDNQKPTPRAAIDIRLESTSTPSPPTGTIRIFA
jgi:hypothetical protein